MSLPTLTIGRCLSGFSPTLGNSEVGDSPPIIGKKRCQELFLQAPGTGARPNIAVEPTPNSLRSYVAVRRESGVEECGNTLDIQVSNEPLERSATDHSLA